MALSFFVVKKIIRHVTFECMEKYEKGEEKGE